jgi:RNA polymerase sigma-70 factor (ECF subfamily)
MKSDEELMIDYINGDLDAFNHIYARYKNRVFGLLIKKLSTDKVDDVFQSVFLKLHEKKHLYKPEHSFSPWFFTLIRNHLIDIYRKPQLNSTGLDGHEPHAPACSIPIEIPSFDKLPKSDQDLLYKKFVAGHDYNELSLELNQSSTNLRKKVSRILKKLRSNSTGSL